MFSSFLNEVVQTSVPVPQTAAGAANITGSQIDMASAPGAAIRLVCILGTLSATQVTALKLQQGNAANGSDAVDIPGAVTPAAADADGGKCLILDVAPSLITKRYVTPVVLRGTANAVIGGVIADVYRTKTVPTTQAAAAVSQAKQAQ